MLAGNKVKYMRESNYAYHFLGVTGIVTWFTLLFPNSYRCYVNTCPVSLWLDIIVVYNNLLKMTIAENR